MKKINFFAPICGTGYGVTSINILKHLHKFLDITLFPISSHVVVEKEEDYNIMKSLIEKEKNFDHTAPCIKIWHQFDLASRIGNGKYYGFPIFELDTFKSNEIQHLRSCDHIFVCSKWAQNVIKNHTIDVPVSVVPLGCDPEIFNPALFEGSKRSDKYIFVTIGKWEIRKGHDVVIECFNKAFSENDNVELWLVTHNTFLSDQEKNYWHDLVLYSKLKNKTKIFNRLNTQYDVASIINYANCGLYLSRAEGWNLELLETIFMNRPVITTNYSGHTEFCNKDNAFLVDINHIEIAHDNKWFHGEGNWAKIGNHEKNQIIEHMLHCYNNYIDNNPGTTQTRLDYNWKKSTNTMLKCIH